MMEATRTTRKKVLAITFDLDNTLWDTSEVIGNALVAFHSFLKKTFPEFHAKYDSHAFSKVMSNIKRDDPEIAHDFTALRKKV